MYAAVYLRIKVCEVFSLSEKSCKIITRASGQRRDLGVRVLVCSVYDFIQRAVASAGIKPYRFASLCDFLNIFHSVSAEFSDVKLSVKLMCFTVAVNDRDYFFRGFPFTGSRVNYKNMFQNNSPIIIQLKKVRFRFYLK